MCDMQGDSSREVFKLLAEPKDGKGVRTEWHEVKPKDREQFGLG
jgi:hypothetical protein